MQIFDHDQTQDVEAKAIEKSNSFKEEALEPDVKIEKDEETSDKRYRQLLKRYVTSFIKDASSKVTIASDGNDTENSSFVVINSELEKEVKIQFLENVSIDTDSHSENGVAVRDYELILWGIEATPYILHLTILEYDHILNV